MEQDEILSSQQVAKLLGISRSYVYVFVKSGQIKPIPTKTVLKRPHLKFRRSEVERFLQQETASNFVANVA